MGIIPIPRSANHDVYFRFSPSVDRSNSKLIKQMRLAAQIYNRNLLHLYDPAPIFENRDGTDDPAGPPHITMVRIHGPHQPGEITVVPNPTPDTGLPPTREAAALPFSTPEPTPPRTQATPSATEHLLNTFTQPSLLPPSGTTLTISPLFTNITLPATSSTVMVSMGTSKPLITYDSSTSGLTSQTKKPLPRAGIVGVAAGGSFLLIGLVLLLRRLRPPRRRRIPKPSLPRLENDDPDEKVPVHESPLFGPNERFSHRPGLNPTWSWVTYPRTKPTAGVAEKSQNDDTLAPDPEPINSLHLPQAAVYSHHTSSSIYPPSSRFHAHDIPVNSPPSCTGQPPLQQIQTAVTRATNRMSTMSLSHGPTCTQSKDTGTPFTGDGHEVTKRRSRTLRKSRSNSVYDDCSRISRLSVSLAYDGADVASPIPPMEFMPLDSSGCKGGDDPIKVESRSRIQTPYYTAVSYYPRISTGIPTTYGVATRVKLGDGASIREVSSPALKSDSQRAKETRALTRALGLASPITEDSMPSPQPTLYPDDSLSIVESKRLLKQRNFKKRGSTYLGDDDQFNQVSDGRRQRPVATPTRSVVAVASGSLVSADDLKAIASGNGAVRAGLPKSLTGPMPVNSKLGIKSTLACPKSEAKTNDKPPRVPSPPPLPSLSQMALQHNNPEAYANYRSPTYSIYNLYDDNRKSIFHGGK